MKKYTIQEIEAALDIIREAIPGITIPKINYGTAIGGASAPENNATAGATWGVNLSSIPDIVAALVTGILGAWNVTNFNLRSGNSDASSGVLLDPINALIRLGATTGDYITLDGLNQRLRSSNYAAGVSGFNISPTLIEAENIIARGTLRGATFASDIISAVGGQLMVANASSLAVDMTAADDSTLTIKDDTTFAVNDILLMRAVTTSGIQEEWLRVTDITDAPEYVVTRDLAGSFSSGANPAWEAGTPVVKQGSSNGTDTYSGGWLRLIGEGTNSPYYSVFQRNGVAYNAFTEVCRLGNLNGFLDYTTDIFGIALGDSGSFLKYDVIDGLRVEGTKTYYTVAASNNLKSYADAERTQGSGGAKKKEFDINYYGSVRIFADIKKGSSLSSPNAVFVYKNGSFVGDLASVGSLTTSYATFSYDLTGLVPGDLIQLIAEGNSSDTTYIKNARLAYNRVYSFDTNVLLD